MRAGGLAGVVLLIAVVHAGEPKGPRVIARHVLDVESPTLFKPEPSPRLQGPLASIDAVCGSLEKTQRRFDFAKNEDASATCDGCTFTCHATELVRLTSGLPGPIREVVLFTSQSQATDTDNVISNAGAAYHREAFLDVAIRMKDGWYVAADLDGALGSAFTIESIESHATGEDETRRRTLVIRYEAETSISKRFRDSHESVVLIGADLGHNPEIVRSPVLVRASKGYATEGGAARTRTTTRSRAMHVLPTEIVFDEENTVSDVDQPKTSTSKRISVRVPL